MIQNQSSSNRIIINVQEFFFMKFALECFNIFMVIEFPPRVENKIEHLFQ